MTRVHFGQRPPPPAADQGLGHGATLLVKPEAGRSECGFAQRLRVIPGLGESRRVLEQDAGAGKVALTSLSMPGCSEQRRKFLLGAI